MDGIDWRFLAAILKKYIYSTLKMKMGYVFKFCQHELIVW